MSSQQITENTDKDTQATESITNMREDVAKHRCHHCGCKAEIFDDVFKRYACIDCADVDHGGGHI